MRITLALAKVLAALLDTVDTDVYGLDLMQVTGLASGTLYPMLQRLREAGWVTAHWEDIDPAAQGRPARRYYRLTAEGVHQARQTLAELRDATRPSPAGGAGAVSAPAW